MFARCYVDLTSEILEGTCCTIFAFVCPHFIWVLSHRARFTIVHVSGKVSWVWICSAEGTQLAVIGWIAVVYWHRLHQGFCITVICRGGALERRDNTTLSIIYGMVHVHISNAIFWIEWWDQILQAITSKFGVVVDEMFRINCLWNAFLIFCVNVDFFVVEIPLCISKLHVILIRFCSNVEITITFVYLNCTLKKTVFSLGTICAIDISTFYAKFSVITIRAWRWPRKGSGASRAWDTFRFGCTICRFVRSRGAILA